MWSLCNVIFQNCSICVLTTWQWVNEFWVNYSFKGLWILKAGAPGPEIEMRVERKIGTLRGRRASSVRSAPRGSWMDGWIERWILAHAWLNWWQGCGVVPLYRPSCCSWPICDMLSSPAGGRHSLDTVWYLKGLSEDVQITDLSQSS